MSLTIMKPGSRIAGKLNRIRFIKRFTNMSIRGTIMGTAGKLIGLAIALAVVSVVAGLGVMATGVSAGLASAIAQIVGFLGLIGLGIAVGVLINAFGGGD